jgi:DNA/RNA endonuclease YhcR with UshA esterase domain
VVYNKFGLTITEGENITVKGFVGIYSNTLQIMPIEVSAVTGVENVNVNDANAPVEYFNLQGVKVANDNLSNGVYIRRQGTSVSKVLVK